MADRYTYMPLIGLFIMVAWGVPDILKEWGHRKIALIVSAGVVLLFFITIARLQVYRWQSTLTLFKHTVSVTANNFIVHNNLGTFLEKQGKNQEAAAHYTQALRIEPDYTEAHNNLGILLARQGRQKEAAEHFSQGLGIEIPGNLGFGQRRQD